MWPWRSLLLPSGIMSLRACRLWCARTESPPAEWVHPKHQPPAEWLALPPGEQWVWEDPNTGQAPVYERVAPASAPPRDDHSVECLFDEPTCPDPLACPMLGQYTL